MLDAPTPPAFGPVLGATPLPSQTPPASFGVSAPVEPSPTAAPVTPSFTFGPVIGGDTSTQSGAWFVLRQHAISFRPHPEGCSVLSLAGQVSDAGGSPLGGYRVRIWGQALDLSATTEAGTHGAAEGFQVVLADQPQEMTLRLQLFQAETGAAVSEVVWVRTLARCEANQLIAEFVPAPN